MKRKRQGQKGSFGHTGLPVSARYLYPRRRWRTLLAAAALALGVVALALVGERMGGARLMSNGPLSSSHATFEHSCDSCHTRGESAADRNCSSCHERFGGGLGVYSFAAHYLHGTRELERLEPSAAEMPCRSCHGEHFGRDAAITRVPDARCVGCHPFGSFERQHPEFDFAAEGLADAASLRFPHIHHVRELLRTGAATELEQSCLVCHTPRADGRAFEPIRFDAHCRDCHLPPTNPTPRLWLAGSLPDGLGVVPPAAIRREDRLDGAWVRELADESFRQVPGGRVVKLPVSHADPWILDNLKRLRRRLYEPGPLADLLESSPVPPTGAPGEVEAVYAEAIATLESYMAELGRRPQPELQGDLSELRRALARIRERVDDPETELGPGAFAVAERAGPSVALLETGNELIDALALPCLRCHTLSRATIERVQADQRTLHRAEFDHRAHVLQRGCLDCHARIPFAERLDGRDAVPEEVDGAAIQNLPAIATCRECHGAAGAASGCVACHLFHPGKERHGQLLIAAR